MFQVKYPKQDSFRAKLLRGELEYRTCQYCGEKLIPSEQASFASYKRRKFCNASCAASYNNQFTKRKVVSEPSVAEQPLNKAQLEQSIASGQRYKKKKKNECLYCGEPVYSKYCSASCQVKYEQAEWEKKWFAGEVSGNTAGIWQEPSGRVRTYLFRIYDSKCARCGWGERNPFTGSIPLEIEHLDGNAENTTPENVTLLCPNCHSLTATYRGANIGHGRPKTWRPK